MNNTSIILPKNLAILEQLGEHIKLARLRRRLGTEQVAERASMSRMTLSKIEKGAPNVAIGSYLQVLFVLGLEKDLLSVGSNDPLGRRLQDAGILIKKRAPKRNSKP